MARKELLYGLLQSLPILALANADFNGTSLDNCMDFDLTQVEEYTPMLDFTSRFPLNFTSSSEDDGKNFRPFGALKSDWSRLSLLHNALPEDSTLKNKFKHLFRLLLIAHEQATKSALSAGTQDVQEFQDSVTTEITESFSTEEKKNMQDMDKQTSIVEGEEYLSSISPTQEARENLKMLTIVPTSGDTTFDDFDTITSSSMPIQGNFTTVPILDTKDGVDSATMKNTSELMILDYEEEKTTASTILDIETELMNSSTIFEDSITTVDVNGVFSYPSLNKQNNITATTIVAGPCKTSSDEKTTVPISTTISDEEIISNSSHENVSFTSGEFMSTLSILQPTTVEKGTNSSDRESEEIFGFTSSNFTSRTWPILKDEFEQPSSEVKHSSGGTISNFLSTKIQSLPPAPSRKLLTSTKMADNTVWTLSSTTEIPVKHFDKSKSLGSTTTERVPISTMVSAENSSGLQSSIITDPEEYSSKATFQNSPTTQSFTITTPSEDFSVSRDRKLKKIYVTPISTSEEYSSAATFINSPTTQRYSIMTPSEELSISRDRKLEKISLTPFSTSEEYSSKATFKNSPTTQSFSVTTPSEEFSISTVQKLGKTSWTPFTAPEEYSSEEIIVYSMTTDSQSSITTLSEDNSESTNQNDEKTLWTHSSITGDPMEELTNTESPIWINNITLQFSKQEEPISNGTQTQSTLNVKSSSDVSASGIQESWTTPILPRFNSSEDLSRTISSTENDEIKTTNYDDGMEILLHKLANNKSNVFTSTSENSTTSRHLVGSTERTHFQEETTSYFDKPLTIIIHEKTTEASRGSKYTNKWETSQSGNFRNNLTIESRNNETGSIEESTNNDTSAITKEIETSTYLETSTIKAGPSFVKNPLHHSPSRNNNIFRDYKHDSDDTGSERNAESPQIVLYESGAGSRNRSIWRPHLARQPPAGNNIWRFDTFPKNVNPSGNQRPSTFMETTNASNVRQETENSTKWPFHGRTNVLRSRKRGSANENVEKQFIWFYRQAGQSEDRDKSRDKENDDTKIKIQCNK